MGIAERREREKQEMQDLILTTAAELFLEVGMEKTSIRTIAEKIEYSPATIYLYFKDKNELLYAIHQRAFQRFFQYFQTLPQLDDPMEKLQQLGHIYFKFAFDNPAFYDLMFILKAPMDSDQTEEHWEMGARSHDVLTDLVLECQQAGHFQNKDTQVLSHMIWATVHGIVSLKIRERMKMYPEALRDQMVYDSLEMFNSILESV